MNLAAAIMLMVGVAIGAFIAGLMRYGNLLDITPIGRIVLVTVISAILLIGIGLFIHFRYPKE